MCVRGMKYSIQPVREYHVVFRFVWIYVEQFPVILLVIRHFRLIVKN